jgi:PAS domain S-box-containing protein
MAMRVGELARQTGVGISTLRAWERRFGLLRPERTSSGQRLYTEADVERVAAVSRLVAEGLTLAAAAGRVAAAGTGVMSSGEGEAFLLHQVMHAADQGIWVSNEGRTRFANRRMGELMRCSIDELMVRSVLDFVDPELLETVKERGRLGREGHHQRYEIRLRRADGSSFLAEVSTTPLRDAAGAYKGAVAVISDVTDRSAAESEARFRTALLDAIGEAVLAARPDGTLVYANPAAEQLFGWRLAELLGQNGLELLAAPGGNAEAMDIHSRLVSKVAHSGEVTLSRRDGAAFSARMTGSPVLDDGGGLVGVIGVLSDNTERHRVEAEIRTYEQQADTVALFGARALRGTLADRAVVLIEAVEAARRVLQGDRAALLEVVPDREALEVRVSSPHVANPPVIPSGSRSFAGYAALAGKVVFVEDATVDRRFDLPATPGHPRLVSAIAAPVFGPAGVCGVLIVIRTVPQKFSPSAVHFMQSIANVIGFAQQQV